MKHTLTGQHVCMHMNNAKKKDTHTHTAKRGIGGRGGVGVGSYCWSKSDFQIMSTCTKTASQNAKTQKAKTQWHVPKRPYNELHAVAL